jgi:hypothetical protein
MSIGDAIPRTTTGIENSFQRLMLISTNLQHPQVPLPNRARHTRESRQTYQRAQDVSV